MADLRQHREKIKAVLARLRRKGWRHWAVAVFVLILGTLVRPYVDEYLGFDKARNWLSQRLLEWYWQPLEPRYVKILLIGDDEYWRGSLAARVPIKRDYLAHLVDDLDAANAAAIALDFDVRLPDPTRLADFPEYRAETEQLIHAILNAAEKRSIVLSKTVRELSGGRYVLEPDIYQLYGLCSHFDGRGQLTHSSASTFAISARASRHISCGYIALTRDRRMLPARLPLTDGNFVDSFALAIARTANPDEAQKIGETVSYGSFIPMAKLEEYHAIQSARDVIQGNEDTLSVLEHRIVVVGAGWSSQAAGRGVRVDLHETPIGRLNGALIHANFAEAFLDSRAYSHVPGIVLNLAEFVFGLLASAVFALSSGLVRSVAGLIGLTGVLIAIQWAVMHLFGVFFEAFLPLVGVWLHSIWEQLFER
jgi:CHASE2 domain-containing sensor protein